MRAAAAALLLACACGPQEPSGPALRFELVVAAGLGDTTQGFQVSVLTQGRMLDCAKVQLGCLVDQVQSARFLPLQDAQGVTRKAIVFPLSLMAGMPSAQGVELKGIAPGSDYAVVIEALSKDSPPRLAGSSCNYVKEITAGTNPSLLAATIRPPAQSVACDPRVEK